MRASLHFALLHLTTILNSIIAEKHTHLDSARALARQTEEAQTVCDKPSSMQLGATQTTHATHFEAYPVVLPTSLYVLSLQ